MRSNKGKTCADTLLDLVCYETVCRHMSPEMESLFARHLQSCPSCRRKVVFFRSMLRPGTASPELN
jgi:hypothetical protein